MVNVLVSADAQKEFAQLPLPIQKRMGRVFARLVHWPEVSGAKPLRAGLAGSFRIRTGDYRVVFRVSGGTLTVWKIGLRRDVYD